MSPAGNEDADFGIFGRSDRELGIARPPDKHGRNVAGSTEHALKLAAANSPFSGPKQVKQVATETPS